MLDLVVLYRRSRQIRRLTIIAAAAVAVIVSSRALAGSREWQPIVIKTGLLSGLTGTPVDRLEVMAFHDRRLEPIPFQIDSIIDGAYVLPGGPEATASDAIPAMGKDDDLVMMISDLGDHAPDSAALAPKTLEIRVMDTAGTSRYAYVAASAHPRLSSRAYVRFDPSTDTIETEHYRVAMMNGLPGDFATQNRIDERGPNLIDRFKVRLSTKVLHLIRFSFSEDDVRTRILAWKAGPIRVIRRLSHSVELVLGLKAPVFERNDFFYRDYLENPFQMKLSWAPRIFFSDIRVRLDLDFNHLDGYEVLWSGMMPPSIKIGDTNADLRISGQPPPPVSWIAIRGNGSTTIQTLAPAPDLSLLDRRLYFNDAPDHPDPPEHTAGEHPGIGYVITGWEKLGSGIHTFDSLLITTPGDYSPDVLLEELHTPPTVLVRPITVEK